mmetsp:Transcript_37946/g.100336  ORF Transcript_37946/g.100336 Transcript_37946/m.100336 type:complete len:242 (+) Transcript_37946:238-963(+)
MRCRGWSLPRQASSLQATTPSIPRWRTHSCPICRRVRFAPVVHLRSEPLRARPPAATPEHRMYAHLTFTSLPHAQMARPRPSSRRRRPRLLVTRIQAAPLWPCASVGVRGPRKMSSPCVTRSPAEHPTSSWRPRTPRRASPRRACSPRYRSGSAPSSCRAYQGRGGARALISGRRCVSSAAWTAGRHSASSPTTSMPLCSRGRDRLASTQLCAREISAHEPTPAAFPRLAPPRSHSRRPIL